VFTSSIFAPYTMFVGVVWFRAEIQA
jgi:hypothetical protein